MNVITDGENEMNKISKILYWTLTILLGFVNPLISVGMVVLYYLPKIIQDICQPCNEEQVSEMNSYSEDVLEDMK
jgi:hypothetical protein